jgi:hypothetical protein
MNPSEHLTDLQIAAFSARTLSECESHEVGRHLLGCVNCRGLLPLPNPEQFWTAVLSEQDSERSKYGRPTVSIQSYFQEFIELVSKPSTLVWSSGSLVVILGLTLLILMAVSRESSVGGDMVRSIETEGPLFGPNHQNEEPRIVLPRHSASGDRKTHPSARMSANRKLSERSNPRPKQASKTDHNNGKAGVLGVNANISATRGAMSKCGAERTFEIQLGSEGADLVLRWERIPNAAKYHLYISDDDEILVDEFETETGTSYRLKKMLDPNKAYRLRIVITLENGQTLSVDAQKFSAKDFQSNQKVRRGNAKSEVRCLANQ